MGKLIIRTFGGFDMVFGDKTLSGTAIRRSKMWLVLKYLIVHHKRAVLTEELIDLLWPDDTCANPSGSLNNIIYRLRRILSDFCGGSQFISFSHGQYSWNPSVECSIDTDEFEKLLTGARNTDADVGECVELYKKTLAIYRGDFLRGESNEIWLMSFVNHYRGLYLSAVNELAALYEQRGELDEAVLVYSDAIKIEPYEESLYVRQMRLLIYIGENNLAKHQYQSISKILKSKFDAEPGVELQSLYREIVDTETGWSVDLTEIKTALDNDAVKQDAQICGLETFKRIYCYDKYLDERTQFPVFLAMVTMHTEHDENHDKPRTLMKKLRNVILTALRKCDVVCQYSSNQFILMLTATDEDNKMTPLHRIERLFGKTANAEGCELHVQVVSMRDGETTSLA